METEEFIAFKGEVWLLSWRESHNNGATVTFQLADSDDLDAFKRMTVRKGRRAGQRLMAALVEIGDDELPVKQEKKGGPLSKSAAQMCEYPTFQDFLHHEYPGEWQEIDEGANGAPELGKVIVLERHQITAQLVRQLCNVGSRADLDHDSEAAQRFHELMREYRAWWECKQ